MNKFISVFPISTLLLCSMNGTSGLRASPSHGTEGRASYNNFFDYVYIGPGLFGSKTNIYYEASFKSVANENQIEIIKYQPLTDTFLTIHTLKPTSKSVKTSLLVDEVYRKSEYLDNGLTGPAYIVKVTSEEGTKAEVIYTNSIDYEDRPIISSSKESATVSADEIIHYFDGQNNQWLYTHEYFRFSEYAQEGFYELDSQNYIYETSPLFRSAISSKFSFDTDFVSYPSYLKMVDTNNYFPYLHQSENDPTVLIQGEFYKSSRISNDLSFRLKDSLYIDPSTRLTYKKNHQGLMKTNRLYFPVGSHRIGDESDEGNRFYIIAERAGASKIQIQIPFFVSNFSTSLIGDCSTSEYCIQMEESTPDFGFMEDSL